MYYEINVSWHGQHHFATAERSLRDIYKANSLFKELKEKFPKDEGYEVSCTEWHCQGKDLTKYFE